MPHFSARFAFAGLLPAAMLLAAFPAQAQAVYTSRSAFNTVNPGLTPISFSGLTSAYAYSDYSGSPLILNSVSFSTPASSYVISKDYYAANGSAPYALDNSDFLQATGGTPTELDVALPGNVTAFGADFGTFESPGQIQVLVNGSALLTPIVTTNTNSGSFFGYTSLTPISSLSFIETTGDVNNGDPLNVNGVEFGKASPVPEASTTVSFGLLLGLGLGGAAWSARRKKTA